MMMNQGIAPWVGMPAQMDPNDDKQYLSRHYPEAIAAAGGLPVTIPLLAETGILRPLAERIDGLLLTGNNSDLEPSIYGAARITECGPTQPVRDKIDLFLLEIAFKRKIPVFAICFGVQSLNVFMGGSLVQDIPCAIGEGIRHQDPGTKGEPSHSIRIIAGSVLEEAAGGLEAAVNSTHHQSIDQIGPGLGVIARAPDGVVESVWSDDPSRWMLGVQWHPEKSFGYDSFSRKLFEIFIARCRAVRGIDEGTHS